MSEIVNSRYQGILIPDERFNLDNITEDDDPTAPSNYDQAGPKPGVPESEQSSRMVLQASGEQPARKELGIHSLRAGHPGLERAGYLWYDASEDEPEEYGWDGPQVLTGWEALFWSDDATELSAYPDMIRLQSGKLLASGLQDKTTFHQTIKIYNPDAATRWATAGTLIADPSIEQKGPALLQLPSGRVLIFLAAGAQIDVYFSDDDGANWDPYSYRALDTPVGNADIQQIKAEYSAGEVLLLVQFDDGSPNCAQYASDDLGGRFTEVESDWATQTSENPEAINIVEVDGAFLVIYHDSDAGSPKYFSRRIGSAFDNVTAATQVEIAAGAGTIFIPGCTAWRDDSGVVYCYCHSTGTSEDLTPRRSDDAGDSWADFSETAYFSGNEGDAYLHSYVAEEIAGQVVLLTRWEADAPDEDPQSLGVVYLGGFSKHTAPAEEGTTSFFDTEYVSFAKNAGLNVGGGSYLPIARPGSIAWTASGAGSDLLANAKLEVTTNGDTRFFARDLTSGNEQERLFFELAVEVLDGDGSTAKTEVGARLRIADAASFEYEVSINASATGWALFDEVAAAQVGAVVTTDITTRLHIRIAMEKGAIKSWYATSRHYREFTEGPGGVISDAGATANNSKIAFGNLVSPAASTTSKWGMVGYCFWPERWTPVSNQYAGGWNTPQDLHPKSYSTQPSQIVDKTRIAAVAGPTRYDERWVVKTDYDYPIRQLLPSVSPSPRSTWRSKNTTENIIAWDIGGGLTETRLENSTVGIVLLGINFRTAELESWDGALWQTVASIDAAVGLTSLRFERRGDAVMPETGGAAHKAARYLMMDDLDGGTFVDLTNTKHRKISRNTEGAWTDEAAKHPTAYLDGIDGTEAGAGDCEFWAPSCATIAHNFTEKHRYYRLRIPAQTTADGYFEIGQVVIGAFAIFGTQYSRGRQIVSRNNTELISLPDGQTRARKRGPQAREIEFAWTDGLDASQINRDDPVPDYVARNVGGGAIASVKDSLYLMDSLIARQGGALLPVVYFARIPADSNEEQTNNPRHFVYGRITGSATRSNILGDEERTDLDRLNTITIAEIV